MWWGGEDEQFNLVTLRVINNMISASASVNNEIPDVPVNNTSSRAMQQSTTTKNNRNFRSKNTKKALQDNSSINLQPTQSFLPVSTPAADMLPATPYIPDQHANSLYHPDQQLNKVVPTQQAQAHPLSSPTPFCSSMTGMQLAEMFAPNPSEDNGKHAVKPNYLIQCKCRFRRYQSDAMRDFADVLFIPFANETSFNSLESAEMQFAFRKKVFDCMDTLHKHSSSLGVQKTLPSHVDGGPNPNLLT